MEDECGGPPFTHVHDPEWPPLEWRYSREGWPAEVRVAGPGIPLPDLLFGTAPSMLDFKPFTFGYLSPGEIWRRDVAEASAVFNASGFPFGVRDLDFWSCFRCARPPAPAGGAFGLGRIRIRRVRCALVPAWQAGKLLAAFAV